MEFVCIDCDWTVCIGIGSINDFISIIDGGLRCSECNNNHFENKLDEEINSEEYIEEEMIMSEYEEEEIGEDEFDRLIVNFYKTIKNDK